MPTWQRTSLASPHTSELTQTCRAEAVLTICMQVGRFDSRAHQSKSLSECRRHAQVCLQVHLPGAVLPIAAHTTRTAEVERHMRKKCEPCRILDETLQAWHAQGQ